VSDPRFYKCTQYNCTPPHSMEDSNVLYGARACKNANRFIYQILMLSIAFTLVFMLLISPAISHQEQQEHPYMADCRRVREYADRVILSNPYPTTYYPVVHDSTLIARLNDIKTQISKEPICQPDVRIGWFGESAQQVASKISLKVLLVEILGIETQLQQQRLVSLAVWAVTHGIVAFGAVGVVIVIICVLLACRSRRKMGQQQQMEMQILEAVKELKKQLIAPLDHAEAFVQEIEHEADRVRRKFEEHAQQQRAVLVLEEEKENEPQDAA
jgi:hypothetical protein